MIYIDHLASNESTNRILIGWYNIYSTDDQIIDCRTAFSFVLYRIWIVFECSWPENQTWLDPSVFHWCPKLQILDPSPRTFLIQKSDSLLSFSSTYHRYEAVHDKKNPLGPLAFSNSLLSNSTSCVSPIPLSASQRLSINICPSRSARSFHNQVSPLVDCSPTQSFKSSYWMRRLKWSSWIFSSPLCWYLNLQRTDGLCVAWLICYRVEFLVNSLRSSTYWSIGDSAPWLRNIRWNSGTSREIATISIRLLRAMIRLWWKQIYNCSVLFEQKKPSSVSDNKGKYVDISRVSVLVLMSLRTYYMHDSQNYTKSTLINVWVSARCIKIDVRYEE